MEEHTKTCIYSFPFMALLDVSAIYHYDEGGLSIIWAVILTIPAIILTFVFIKSFIKLVTESSSQARINRQEKINELKRINQQIQLLREQNNK